MTESQASLGLSRDAAWARDAGLADRNGVLRFLLIGKQVQLWRDALRRRMLAGADLLTTLLVCLAIANEQTENLMNAANFARMKKSAYFLNLSRGNLVDEAALMQALESRTIAGAAMDVGRAFDQKPSLNLARRADVIATPHTAGLTPDAIEHQAFDTVRQVGELVAGRIPKEAVNTAKATRLTRLGINDLT